MQTLGKRRKKAFLDLLLDLNENETASMSDDEIRQQVDTFLFAVSQWSINNYNHL